jgi:uncharacterized protein YdhG (YjbR/CyaY superfamily)
VSISIDRLGVGRLEIGNGESMMKRKAEKQSDEIVPGGVDEYIEKMPEAAHARLREIRAATRAAAPRSIETVSYFAMPGYSYAGYDYNGMFAWFSFKQPFVRLHVRPPVLDDHKKALDNFPTTKAIVSFPLEKPIPQALVKTLVKASIKVMKQRKAKAAG